jgi:hypothetical protein
MSTYRTSSDAARASTTIPVPNGRAGHPDDRQLGEIVAWLIADLRAVEQLRHDELRKCSDLRDEIYRNAREVGVSPHLLRALAGLTRPARATRINGNGRHVG